ncbi:MAG: ribulose-phosphate 3-epimerase, partial [Desulfuromonadales bacterium]|nr:ribulose-phosphate 3-epimerase [Desulfuromonadales bacterium]
ACLPKIEQLRRRIDQRGLAIELEVDGGVKLDNIGRIAAAGAHVFVAGSAVFGSENYAATIAGLKVNAAAG